MAGTAGQRRRPPRIALVGPHPSSHGGVAATVRAIEATLSDAFDIVVLPTQVDGPPAAKGRAAAAALRALARGCGSREIDLVHLHSSAGVSFARKAAALAIARRHGTPAVLHVHGGGFAEQLAGRDARGLPARRALRRALRSADAVVALTDGWANLLGGFAGIEPAVIPNAPDLGPAAARSPAANGTPPTIVYLGHLYRDKGVYELLEAFARLRRTRPDLRLVLAGEGRERDALRALAGNGASGVELPGWVDAEERTRLLGSAACLALPSYQEGLPLVVLEAMHAGVPIVASAVGGIPEIARDGREALLVRPRDRTGLEEALARVLDDRALAARLGESARTRAAAEFSRASFARRVAALYQEVLSR
jgi:glycosyltransferase involved in cell wall biosynthesis